MSDLWGNDHIELLDRHISEWLAEMSRRDGNIAAIDRGEADEHRWYVRMRGEEKEFTTVWLTLGQRTLRYETYVMPHPEENAEQLWEHLLRRNDSLVGAHFSIGIEDAVFLRGEMALSQVTADELDRAIGTLWSTVERVFPIAIRIGFASRFAD
ncbi:MAG: YbjN domain-containing protein [Ilumatobacteraceae bacterium]